MRVCLFLSSWGVQIETSANPALQGPEISSRRIGLSPGQPGRGTDHPPQYSQEVQHLSPVMLDDVKGDSVRTSRSLLPPMVCSSMEERRPESPLVAGSTPVTPLATLPDERPSLAVVASNTLQA